MIGDDDSSSGQCWDVFEQSVQPQVQVRCSGFTVYRVLVGSTTDSVMFEWQVRFRLVTGEFWFGSGQMVVRVNTRSNLVNLVKDSQRVGSTQSTCSTFRHEKMVKINDAFPLVISIVLILT
ncbi:hypothetical protein Hanom_Chr08g00735961 [Helianthus anomalus]